MDKTSQDSFANFLVSKQLEADAELMELHGLPSTPPPLDGWVQEVKSLPVYDQDDSSGACAWLLFSKQYQDETVTLGIPTVSYQQKSDKKEEEEETVKFVVNIERSGKEHKLRFYCQAINEGHSQLVINSMTTVTRGKEGEYYPPGFNQMDDVAHDHLREFLRRHGIDNKMADIVFQSWSHYVTSLKKCWATKFLDFIY